MDTWQKTYLEENGPDLLEALDSLNLLFIANLRSLSTGEITRLESLRDKTERNYALLNIMRSKSGGYLELVIATQKTNQTGALQILIHGYKQNSLAPPECVFENSGNVQNQLIESLIVGTEDCKVLDVMEAVTTSTSFHILDERWVQVAWDLGIKDEKIRTLKTNKLLGLISLKELIKTLLDDWVAANTARLSFFMESLTKHGMRNIAENTRRKFS